MSNINMPLHNSRKIAFATKLHENFRIKEHRLIQPVNSIANSLKQMTIDHISMHGTPITSRKDIK